MKSLFASMIAGELKWTVPQVHNTLLLFDEGATIPFVSRYRKEMTGSMDEVQVATVKERYEKLQEIAKRKETMLKTIADQGALSPELQRQIDTSWDLTELEDWYLPYKPKRKTRAVKARERGLEPLAQLLMFQREQQVELKAEAFLTDEVPTVDDALQGARDIIAEQISENVQAREIVRNVFSREALVVSKVLKGKEEEGAKYRDYFDWSEPLRKCPSHRVLAMRRGEHEGFLKVSIAVVSDQGLERLERLMVKGFTPAAQQVKLAVEDSYKRLLTPGMETEFSQLSKIDADAKAIQVFAENLRQLLLASPLGQKRVLAIDPGFRTGCKVVCLDAQGNLIHNETIFPHQPQNETAKSMKKIDSLTDAYKIDAIAIGNGTASRETEAFVRSIKFNRSLQVFVVSEDGASVYSASKVARDEFPEYDVTVRGAISIGRRLMDPLAELVKIDPKSIGVGQYQHDVDGTRLKASLDTVVESCVNQVGVNVNTASKHLLTYVSGLGPQLAQNVVDYRTQNGPFRSRSELKKVARLGAKAFEQCAGFMRIPDAEYPLDNSAVHPESYKIVERMAADLNCTIGELLQKKELRVQIRPEKYLSPQVGLPTLTDILKELDKPGRDPREAIQVFEFVAGITSVSHLRVDMVLPGIVTNITNFGAFVDVGVKQDGLVHISQLADRYVSDPNQVVKLHQHVKVKVVEVDVARKRIQLTMKGLQG